MKKSPKLKTSFTLSQTARDLLEMIAKEYGLSKSGTLELIIRQTYKREVKGGK